MKKRLVALTLAAAMVLPTAAGCGSKELDSSAVVAEVGDEKITVGLANFYARYQQSMYETYYASFLGEDMWSGEVETGVTYEENVKDSIMTSLQTLYVLKEHAADYEVEVSDEEKASITTAAKEFVDNNGLDEKTAVSGDQETIEEYLTLVTIQSKMYKEMIKEADTEVSDEEAAQKSMDYVFFSFYETNEDGESVEVSDDEKTKLKEDAQEIAEAAKSAEAMKKAASKKDYEVQTATFDSESTSPAAALIVEADAVDKGECTGIVETDAGYYVAFVTSLLDKEATKTKKESIISQREQEKYSELCEEWLEETDVTVHDKVWEQISFEKVGVTIKDTTEEDTESTESESKTE